MTKMEILTYGNPVLRQKAEEVTVIDEKIKKIARELEETLSSDDKGIGLAAPQVGICKRILAVDLTRSNGERKITLINPKIIYRSREEEEYLEGCLSIPEVWGNVTRPKKIKVKGTLVSGKTFVIDADEIFARVLQHEMDHLDGILFIDYLSPEDKGKNGEIINAILEKNRAKLGKILL
jgi:peptide deformylase